MADGFDLLMALYQNYNSPQRINRYFHQYFVMALERLKNAGRQTRKGQTAL
jgi:hypothetical protein